MGEVNRVRLHIISQIPMAVSDGFCEIPFNESLKMPKGYSKSINQGRTYTTLAKRKKDKRTNNDLQNITHKTKDRETRTPLKTGGELKCCRRVSSCKQVNCKR